MSSDSPGASAAGRKKKKKKGKKKNSKWSSADAVRVLKNVVQHRVDSSIAADLFSPTTHPLLNWLGVESNNPTTIHGILIRLIFWFSLRCKYCQNGSQLNSGALTFRSVCECVFMLVCQGDGRCGADVDVLLWRNQCVDWLQVSSSLLRHNYCHCPQAVTSPAPLLPWDSFQRASGRCLLGVELSHAQLLEDSEQESRVLLIF